MQRITISGIKIDCFNNSKEIIEKIELFIKEGKPHQIVTLNSLMLNLSFNDFEMREVLVKSSVNIPESSGIIWAIKYLKDIRVERFPGIDLMNEILFMAESKGYKVYFIGSKNEIMKNAVENIQIRYPNIKISGYSSGYWKDNTEEEKIIKNVSENLPDILFVGFSLGMQEKWIYKNLYRLGVPVVIGVGGSFDVFSGKLKRAPVFIRKAGFEWLFRILQEPAARIKNLFLLFNYIYTIIQLKILKN